MIRAKRYLKKAEKELARGDYLQASEKMWGAAAVALKEAGEKFGLKHDKHAHLFRIAYTLTRKFNDAQIITLFNAAHTLHVNFYEDCIPTSALKKYLGDIKIFVGKIEKILSKPLKNN